MEAGILHADPGYHLNSTKLMDIYAMIGVFNQISIKIN